MNLPNQDSWPKDQPKPVLSAAAKARSLQAALQALPIQETALPRPSRWNWHRLALSACWAASITLFTITRVVYADSYSYRTASPSATPSETGSATANWRQPRALVIQTLADLDRPKQR